MSLLPIPEVLPGLAPGSCVTDARNGPERYNRRSFELEHRERVAGRGPFTGVTVEVRLNDRAAIRTICRIAKSEAARDEAARQIFARFRPGLRARLAPAATTEAGGAREAVATILGTGTSSLLYLGRAVGLVPAELRAAVVGTDCPWTDVWTEEHGWQCLVVLDGITVEGEDPCDDEFGFWEEGFGGEGSCQCWNGEEWGDSSTGEFPCEGTGTGGGGGGEEDPPGGGGPGSDPDPDECDPDLEECLDPCDPDMQECEPENCDEDPYQEGCGPPPPCVGNPIEDPRIAAQTNSGIDGGRFGTARNQGTTMHWGLDMENSPGDNVYSLFAGTVINTGSNNTWGDWVMIRSTVNGKTVDVVYAHTGSEVAAGAAVAAGTAIGVSNLSGNLGPAVLKDRTAVPHLHIEVAEVSGSLEWNDRRYTSLHLNPEEFLTTKFQSNGDPVPGTSC